LISYGHYVHPEDRAAFEQLRSIPLFPAAVKAFMKVLPERVVHGMSMAQKIRLGPDQLPELYDLLPPVCETLGIAEPEYYLEMDPAPNAYAQGGAERAFVTITSGLVESMEEDELQAVVAHECGHIACQHVMYHTMAQLLLRFGSSIFGPVAAVSMPLQLGLLYWYRRSELSADRAAAVYMGGAQPVVDTMLRLAGGPKRITAGVNVERYLEQAEAFSKLQESEWDKILMGLQLMNQNHPFLAVRSREILAWCESEAFAKVRQAMAMGDEEPACTGCGALVSAGWRFCRSCGRPLAEGAAPDPGGAPA